jgi:hypothetical protein
LQTTAVNSAIVPLIDAFSGHLQLFFESTHCDCS